MLHSLGGVWPVHLRPPLNHLAPSSISTLFVSCQFPMACFLCFLQAFIAVQVLNSFLDIFLGFSSHLSFFRFP